MSKVAVLKGFNDHFAEFLTALQIVFPENEDLAALGSFASTVRKANPRLAISAWHECVCVPYGAHIERDDVGYFLEKDYDGDLEGSDSKDYIIQSIDKIRRPIALLSEADKQKSMQYIKNLTKLANAYSAM